MSSRSVPDLDEIPPRFEDGRDRLAYLLAEYRLGVVAVGLSVVALVASGNLGIPEIPPELKLVLQGVALGVIPAMFLAKLLIIDIFFPDPRRKIIEWNPYAEDEDGIGIRLWRVESEVWSERVHEQGMPILEPDRGEADAVVTRFSYDDAVERVTVRGVAEDIANPTDLKARNGKLDEIFGELTESKRELDHMRATGSLRQYQIEERTINALIAAVEERVAFTPGATDEVLSEEMFEGVGSEDNRTDAPVEQPEDQETLSDLIGEEPANIPGSAGRSETDAKRGDEQYD